MRSRLLVFLSAFFMVAGLLMALLLPTTTARADSWTEIGSGGSDWGYNSAQNYSRMVEFNSCLYVGTGNAWYESSGPKCEVWRYDGSTWDLVNQNGFGDSDNQYIGSMVVFGSHLYVGTINNDGCEIWRTAGTGGPPFTDWEQVNTDDFGDADNGGVYSMAVLGSNLYAGTYNSSGCEIWRTAGTGGPPFTDWVQVNTNGFGYVENRTAYSMEVYNDGGGDKLYAGTSSTDNACDVYRFDGPGQGDWTQVNVSGFGGSCGRVYSLEVFDSGLYAATNYCRVLRYDGGTTWTQVNVDRFGDASNSLAYSLLSYGSYLYVGTANLSQGCQLWRTAGNVNPSPPPIFDDWVKVNSNGFGKSSNYELASLAAFNGCLYASTQNTYSKTKCEVWETAEVGGPPYTDWSQVNTSGFPINNSISSMAMFQGSLHVGTYSILGCELWRLDGASWTLVNDGGFGDHDNLYASSMVVFGSYLYVGTRNENGCEVWRTDGTGGPPYTWAQANANGFGQAGNADAASMVTYSHDAADYLYVGTENSSSGSMTSIR